MRENNLENIRAPLKNLCINCSQVISNPICEKCFAKQIKYWLADLGVSKIPRKIVLDNIKKLTENDSLNEVKCIICDKENVSICSYCFFLKSVRALREFNFDKELTKNFLNIFNYRQSQEEY